MREWFGVLGQDPRQKAFYGSRTFQQEVSGVVKYMVPLCFQPEGSFDEDSVSAHVEPNVLFLPHLLPPPPPLPDHLYQGIWFPAAGGCADGVQHPGGLMLAWQEVDGELLAMFPQHLFWGWAVAFYMILTSLWWIKVLHKEKQLM